MDGFQNIVRRDQNRHVGGVEVYAKNGLKFKTREEMGFF